jgi:hypothetical protein
MAVLASVSVASEARARAAAAVVLAHHQSHCPIEFHDREEDQQLWEGHWQPVSETRWR